MDRKKLNLMTSSKRQKILIRDKWECQYCGFSAEAVDHVIPWSFSHDDTERNLVAVCNLCNCLAYNKVFDNFDKKKKYIQKTLYNRLLNKPILIWSETELKKRNGFNIAKRIRKQVIVTETDEEKEILTRAFLDRGYKVNAGFFWDTYGGYQHWK